MAASTASTLSLKSKGTSAERVMAILSSRCSLRGPSSGLKVAISSGRHLRTQAQHHEKLHAWGRCCCTLTEACIH